MANSWSGPALLVPITVEALPINDASYLAAWSWVPPNYSFLKLFRPVEGGPFTNQLPSVPGYPKFTGVVIHWALPDGLTHGVQAASGAIVYPDLPNRWLVIRKYVDAARPGAWSYQAWIIASDHAPSATGSPFVDLQGRATVVGRAWPIAEWPGEAEVQQHAIRPPLTATGAGDAAFATYVPNVPNVLSFADPLTGAGAGVLSYSVYGWYAAPAVDPLSGWTTVDEWEQILATAGWAVGSPSDEQANLAAAIEAVEAWAAAHGITVDPDEPRTIYPTRTICHGTVFQVGWPGKDGAFVSGVPTSNPEAAGYVRPRVAIGHSTIDALAALLGAAAAAEGQPPDQVSQLVDILEAFQYDALDLFEREDFQAQLDLKIQGGWFDATGGGTAWTVVPPQVPPAAGADPPPALTPAQEALLTALNTAQRALDETARGLSSQQGQLFDLWWKDQRLASWLPPPKDKARWQAQLASATGAVEPAILAQVNRWIALAQERDRAYVALRAALGGELVLKADARPAFHAPSEPVVMVTGAHRSYKHGEDGRFTDDDTLFVRFTGQTVSGLEVQVRGAGVRVDASNVAIGSLPMRDLPLELADLNVEQFFLDLTDAPAIASAASPADPWSVLDDVRREQTLIWNAAADAPVDQQTVAALSGLQFLDGRGALPSKVGVELWAPPWAPLYLDWQVNYYPGQTPPSAALEPWTFTASGGGGGDPRDDFTYAWSGPVPPRRDEVFALEGRTFLSPQATDTLAARLEQAIEAYADQPTTQADLWALEEALAYVRNADVLSQAMSGFNAGLLERSPRIFASPATGGDRPDPVAPYLDPALAPSFTPTTMPVPDAAPVQLQPIRGGFLAVQRLWVVDGFGQVFDVLGAMGLTPANFQPILGTDLAAPGSAQLVELKPRVTQFTRLGFELLSAADDAQIVGVAAGANPICGWLIPNHLDDSLLVYDAGGALEGELLRAQGRALWLPAPDTHPPPRGGVAPPVEIANVHLAAIVNGILGAEDSERALRGLIALIDEASWAIDPTGGWADQELPALIGQPVAVVRAHLALETLDALAESQRWDDTGRGVTGGVEAVAFPVQLGSTELLDDGLIGYYLNDRYGRIESAYRVTPETPYVGHALPSPTLDGAGALLTMLMAPRAKAHALSGILPPQVLTLPGELATPALAKMAVLFRTGPVLNDPAQVAVPLPALRQGAWSWLQYVDTTSVARSMQVTAADDKARLPTAPPLAREGWLSLVLGGPPTTFTYSIAPASAPITTDPDNPSAVIARVSIYNGSGAAVAFSQIQLAFPVGNRAADVTTAPELFAPSLPDKAPWRVDSDGQGRVTLTPAAPGAALAKGATLVLSIAGVQLNRVAGSATIGVVESTDQTRSGSLDLIKVQP